VEVVDEERQSATVLLDEAVNALWGVGAAEAEDAWVPDQDTGVFVPAEEAAGTSSGSCSDGPHKQPAGPSALGDQATADGPRRADAPVAEDRWTADGPRRADAPVAEDRRRGAGRTG